jgi:carbonyl reductase 1
MSSKIVVVTGANKGIGKAIVVSLLEKLQNSVVYLTARDENRGQKATTEIISSESSNYSPSKNELRYHQLDITDDNSCKNFADYIQNTHQGLDILINNAGIMFSNDATESPEIQAEVTIGINYYGTKLISSHLLPLLRKDGRLVNICSTLGVMKKRYSEERIKQLTTAKTMEEIDSFVEEYKKHAKDNTRKEAGFPESAYQVSKSAEIALTFLQAKELEAKGVIVNACCPGFVATSMTNFKGYLTVEQGADTPIYLAINPSPPKSSFVYQRKVRPWY